jgi:hypothetical protein
MSLEHNHCANLLVTSLNSFVSVVFIVELDDEACLCHIYMYLYVIMLYVGNFEYMGLMEC